ncbi:hypothetical protein [uncultured Bifidobacterium sp.]|uniref:hypothetical protein n=1 Tax=uncultured Bifidobacterium sp. TaxID=165187 RepID=UPI0028DBA3A2|nr:hypothetical protein [uncultured Bifidobacterium sp.]
MAARDGVGRGGSDRLGDVDPPFVIEGLLAVAFGGGAVPYRISMTFRSDLDRVQFHAAAMRTCQLACMAADMVRGRDVPPAMERVVSTSCLSRLRTMSMLMDIRLNSDAELRSRMCKPPVVPRLVNGMLVSPTRFDMSVCLGIGSQGYCSSVVLSLMGSRWVCVLADFG